MEPNKPHDRNRKDLHDALALADWLEENKVKDKRGVSEGYVIKEGWDIYDMMHSVVMLARAYRGKVSIAQYVQVEGQGAAVVGETPLPSPLLPERTIVDVPKPLPGGAALKHPVTATILPTLNVPASARCQDKIPSILF